MAQSAQPGLGDMVGLGREKEDQSQMVTGSQNNLAGYYSIFTLPLCLQVHGPFS